MAPVSSIPKESTVNASRNIYCTCCHKTQRFLDHETHYGCPVCAKRLDKVVRVAKDENVVVTVTRVA